MPAHHHHHGVQHLEVARGVPQTRARSRAGRIGFTSGDADRHSGQQASTAIPNAVYSLDVTGQRGWLGCPGCNTGSVRAVNRELPSALFDLYNQQDYTELVKKIENAYSNYTCSPLPWALVCLCSWPCIQFCWLDDALGSTIGVIISEENNRLVNIGLEWMQPADLTRTTSMLMVLTHTPLRRTYERANPHRRQLLAEVPRLSDNVSPPPPVMLHLAQPIHVQPQMIEMQPIQFYHQAGPPHAHHQGSFAHVATYQPMPEHAHLSQPPVYPHGQVVSPPPPAQHHDYPPPPAYYSTPPSASSAALAAPAVTSPSVAAIIAYPSPEAQTMEGTYQPETGGEGQPSQAAAAAGTVVALQQPVGTGGEHFAATVAAVLPSAALCADCGATRHDPQAKFCAVCGAKQAQ